MPRDFLSSDEEDDDQESLVPQNHHHPKSPRSRHSFEISTPGAPKPSTPLLLILAAVFLAISIPTALILLLRRPSPQSPKSPSETSRFLEADLQALRLLRTQQLDLIALSNQTNSLKTDELKSALIHQLNINRQIQNALLSPHRPTNYSTSNYSDDGGVGLDLFAQTDFQLCGKTKRLTDRKTIEWKPNKDRFLLAVCVSGQMSNHLICLEKHMFFAAILGRVLVFPSEKFDYDYESVLDLKHINDCFGRNVVTTFDEFAKLRKDKVRVDRFLCYMANPPCYLDEDHVKKLKGSGIEIGKIEAVWPEDAKLNTQKKRVVGDVVAKFSVDDEVIAVGDMFYADVEDVWVMQPGGPLAHSCKTVIQPNRLIYLTAQRFVQTFLGSNFVALHFRRHGFLKFCNVKEQSCFFPIPQAAECIQRVLEKVNAPVIYLSTDAAPSETNLLQSLIVVNDRQIPLVKRPEHTSVEKWDALLYRNHLGGDSQVEAMLDKTICALSSVFIGSSGSTFTEDIIRLRRGWESASQCDEYLCQGQLPNYIAESD